MDPCRPWGTGNGHTLQLCNSTLHLSWGYIFICTQGCLLQENFYNGKLGATVFSAWGTAKYLGQYHVWTIKWVVVTKHEPVLSMFEYPDREDFQGVPLHATGKLKKCSYKMLPFM